MSNPRELASTAEQLDEEQWFEFLEELDAVSRRRQQGKQVEPEPPSPERDGMALWIARRHLAADSGIQKVVYLPKGAPADEIRLLEVNDRQAPPESGGTKIEPIDFGLNVEGVSLRLMVADITSEQLDAIQAGRLALPPGWDPADAITTGRRS